MGKRYTLANGADLYRQSNNIEYPIVTSTGLVYSQGVPINYYESVLTGSTEGSTMTAYGVTRIVATAGAASSALTVYLGLPIPGVPKTLVVESTADLVGNLNVDLSSDATLAMGTSNAGFRYITFSTLGDIQSLSLMGLTTAQWAVTATISTGGAFGSAAGIRATTALSS